VVSDKVAVQPKLGYAVEDVVAPLPIAAAPSESTNYEECLACQ